MSRPLTDSEALTAILAEEAGKAGPSEVPEPELLLDYLVGRLSPEEEEILGRRLAADPEAARALLDLADFEAAGAEAGSARERPREIGIQAGWRDLEKRLPAAPPALPVRRPKALWASSALAAVLLVMVVGLGLKNGEQSDQIARLQRKLSQPVALMSLILASVRAEGESKIALSPGEQFRLVLTPEEDCQTYSVQIEGPRERDSRTAKNLRTDDQGKLSLLLEGWPGEYRLILSGCKPERKLERYVFRISARAG